MIRRAVILSFLLVAAAVGRAGVAQWNSVVGADDPFHWYKFDEGSGTVCGDSGSGTLNGTYSGVVLGREGLLEGATAGEFTGSSIVDFGQVSPISSDWTAEYIVKKTADGSQALHDDGNTSLRVQGWAMEGLSFTQYGVADYRFTVEPGQSDVAPIGEWIHLVFRKTTGRTEAFINGQLVGTQSSTVNLPLQTLGGRRGTVGDALYGFLDEAVVYNRALPDERIRIHADACTGTFSVALPDDFETYADTTELQGNWNSSGQLSLETVETRGGGKSMKTVLSTASAIDRDFGEDFDYSHQDGKDLVLWFKGDEANTEGDVTLSVYDGSDNVVGNFTYRNATTATEWTTMGLGVDIARQPGWSQIRKVQIDIASPCTMYFDDLVFQDRLLSLGGDLNGDNRVDVSDLAIFAGQWLDESCYGADCADFDGVDGVDMGDFAVLADNWNFDPSGLVISEFMAINSYVPFVSPTDIHTTINGQTEHPDWIEIHNTDVENAVSLNGWYLTDDRDNKAKWRFPDVVIPADGYLVVFASLKKRADHPENYPYVDDEGNLHTNFQLGNNGEYLALVRPDGVTAAHEYAPEYPRQYGLVSFGTNEEGQTGYLKAPTPRLPNSSTYDGVVADTNFSVERGFYQAGQTLEVVISCATADAVIRYTLDGSTPSLTRGAEYTEGNAVVIDSTTCLRAAAFKAGWLSSNVDTQTYIFLDDVISQSPNGETPPGWPSGSVNGQVFDYGMDPDVVQSAEYGSLMMEAMTAIPSISLVTDMANLTDPGVGIYVNATREGIQWERPVSAELIYPDGTEGFQADAGLRIRGAYSRAGSNPKHSFRLLFRGGYGDTKLEYPIFGDEGPDRFDNIDLRTAQNYAWSNWGNDGSRNTFLRDVYSRDLQREMGRPYTRSRYYHLYLNGQYWGLFQSQERSEASYAETYFGGYEEDYDVVKTDSYRTSFTDGSLDAWNALWWLCEAGFETSEKYYAVQGKGPDGKDDPAIEVHVDVENLIDYMLDIFFAGNRDAPVTLSGGSANNFYAIRNRDPRLRQGWKFFAYDSEHSMLSAGEDRTITVSAGSQIAHFNPQWLHQKLMINPEYRMTFADGAHRHMFNGGILTTQRATDLLLARAAEIDMAIIGESARWGDQRSDRTNNPYTKAHWWAEVNGFLVETFLAGRRNVLLNQLRNRQLYPNVEAPAFSRHGGYVDYGFALTMSAPVGTIYYTIDGTDPYRAIPPEPDASVVLVAESASKRVFVPTSDIGSDWTGGNEPYGDSMWNHGTLILGKAGGVGYERSSGNEDYITYDVEARMYGAHTCAYVRIPFTIDQADLEDKNYLKLHMRYDDGFVAYLNGEEVARSDSFTGVPAWNSTAGSHEANSRETFDISDDIDKLKVGENILAVHGINFSLTSSDFLVWPQLVIGKNASGGEVSDTAIAYTSPLTLDGSAHIKSRVLSQGLWSALNEAVFAVGSVKENLRITEIMYHPGDPNEEFIELQNVGVESIDLNLVRLTKGVDFDFGPLELAGGEYVLVVGNEQRFLERYPGFVGTIAGQYEGNLDNGGERIRLRDALGEIVSEFTYKDGWYDITDGMGFSLTLRAPAGSDPNTYGGKSAWRPSAMPGGSPGDDDSSFVVEPGSVVVNEVLAHSHAGAPDWIELHNTTSSTISIGGWFLSDSNNDLMKYEIAPGVSIRGGEYVVFTENLHFGNTDDPGCDTPFALSENGDTVYLHSGVGGALTGYSDEEEFGASARNVALGRYRKSTGTYNFVAMSWNTPREENAYPKVGPVVISEIMYHPQNNDDAEYVELLNIGDEAVKLYNDLTKEPWKLADEGGFEFLFPDDPVTMDVGERILLVKNPQVFEAEFTAPAGTQVFSWGPEGSLGNGGERIQLSMPGDVDGLGERQYIRVDRVNYSDGMHPEGDDPWPVEADGTGESLHRRVADEYGNDVINWRAGEPTPGT